MAWNDYKPRGVRKESRPDANGTVIRGLPVFGIVKDNIDPLRMGRLQVYLADNSSRSPDDKESWVTVSYMSPFYGLTEGNAPKTGNGTYEANPSSYGMWVPAPDIGTTVICIFINGDPNFGFWIGCVPEPEALHMVPAVGSAENVVLNEAEAKSYGGAKRAPVTNVNNNNEQIANTADYLTAAKPVHSYQASVLNQQGLIRDSIRGVIGSNSQRETPSRVTGISTPGRPVYEGGYTDENVLEAATADNTVDPSKLKVVTRRGGHTLVMDDGDIIGRDQLIRLRTAMGHQILMSDDGQALFIIHSNGQSWIELGKEGTIDMYATNSVNIRTQGDLNLHADRDINMYAGRNIQAASQMEMKLNAEAGFEARSTSKMELYSEGNYTVKTNAAMSFDSKGEAGFKSDATVYIVGKPINLNTGSPSVIPKEPKYIPFVAHPDTLWDDEKGFLAAPGKLLSTVTRAPAHQPWAMAGLGVDVEVKLKASSVLPAAPSAAVSDAQSAAPATPENPVSAATIATANPTMAVSAAIDKATTGALLTTVATAAQNGPTALAAKVGAAVVTGADGVKSAAVGQLGLSPAAMSTVLKPGAERLVESLVQQGATVMQAMPSNLMSGVPGASTVKQLANDVAAQQITMTYTLQKSQTALTSAGVITGKEAPSAISGIVLAGATAGIRATTNVLQSAARSGVNSLASSVVKSIGGNNPITQAIAKSAVSAVGNAVSQGVSGALNAVAGNVLGGLKSSLSSPLQALSAGKLAGNLASGLTGGLGALGNNLALSAGAALNAGVNQAVQGVSAAAFNSIVGSLPTMVPGVPQNLREIANKATLAAQSDAGPSLSDTLGKIANNTLNTAIKGAVNGVTNVLTREATSLVSGTLRGAVKGVPGIAGVITGAAVNAAASSINSVITTGARAAVNNVLNSANMVGASASGLGGLVGGQTSVATIANRAVGAAALPGTDVIGGVINNVTRAVTGAAVNAASGVLSGTMNKITGDLSKSLSKAVGGGVIGNAVAAGLTGALKGSANALIKQATNSLTQLALSGLPKAAGAQLNAAIGSLNSGPVSVSLPKAATGTSDIGDQAGKLNSLMSKRVPKPNFTGNPATIGDSGAADRVQRVDEWASTLRNKRTELAQLNVKLSDASAKASEAFYSLPQGDPRISALNGEVDAINAAYRALEAEIAALEKSPPG